MIGVGKFLHHGVREVKPEKGARIRTCLYTQSNPTTILSARLEGGVCFRSEKEKSVNENFMLLPYV